MQDEVRAGQAKVAVQTTERLIEIIDKSLDDFGQKVREGTIELSNVADFEKMVRLRSSLEGKADKVVQHTGIIGLAEVQARYRGIRSQEETITVEMTGVETDQEPLRLPSGEFDPFDSV